MRNGLTGRNGIALEGNVAPTLSREGIESCHANASASQCMYEEYIWGRTKPEDTQNPIDPDFYLWSASVRVVEGQVDCQTGKRVRASEPRASSVEEMECAQKHDDDQGNDGKREREEVRDIWCW